MPYPLAHPAAVLPLRRFCPRRLNLPALVIGSLVPDLGYAFGAPTAEFSHRFWSGAFGFCLPVGFLLWLGFYLLRPGLIGRLPARQRDAILPLCQPPLGSPFIIPVSLLLGFATHWFLDSLTHANGWLVEQLPVLQSHWRLAGGEPVRVHDLLYYICTFCGTFLVSFAFLNWLEAALRPVRRRAPVWRWVGALLFAIAAGLLAVPSRMMNSTAGMFLAGLLFVVLVVGFVVASAAFFGTARREV